MKKIANNILEKITLLRDFFVPLTVYRYKLGHINRKFSGRTHVARYEVQQDVHVDIYWKAIPRWTGPSVSFYVYGAEVLRFDCFGQVNGHYHVDFHSPWATQNNKLYFYERTLESQIERTLYELKTNLGFYLQRNPNRKVRNIEIDQEKLHGVCEKIRGSMYHLLDTVPELQELK